MEQHGEKLGTDPVAQPGVARNELRRVLLRTPERMLPWPACSLIRPRSVEKLARRARPVSMELHPISRASSKADEKLRQRDIKNLGNPVQSID